MDPAVRVIGLSQGYGFDPPGDSEDSKECGEIEIKVVLMESGGNKIPWDLQHRPVRAPMYGYSDRWVSPIASIPSPYQGFLVSVPPKTQSLPTESGGHPCIQ